jgi:DNA-binding SARP family transcriptional activator
MGATLVEYKILGGFEIVLNGNRLHFSRSREQQILAVLLLEANRLVPLAKLVDTVWGDRPPRCAIKAVRNCVSTLRRRLDRAAGPGEMAAGPGEMIVTEPAGYALRVEEDQVDLRMFERHVARGRGLAAAGQLEQAAGQLRRALALWRGDALAGVRGRVIEAAASRLDEQRLTVHEECLSYELALGYGRQLVDELSALVASQPLREGPRGQLMLALYRSGRRTEALQTFRQARHLMVRELGLEPGPELARLHQAILTGEPDLGTSAPEWAREPARTGLRIKLRGFGPTGAPVHPVDAVRGLLSTAGARQMVFVLDARGGHAEPGPTCVVEITGEPGLADGG